MKKDNKMNEETMMSLLMESDWSKADIVKAVKDAIKNDRDVNKEFDKKVKNLVAAAVNTLFRTLWQRRNFYEDEIKR